MDNLQNSPSDMPPNNTFFKPEIIYQEDTKSLDSQNINYQFQPMNIEDRYENGKRRLCSLTPVSFAYKIWQFKYEKRIDTYVIRSLFWDEVRNILHDGGFAKRKAGKNFIYIQKRGAIIEEVSSIIMRNYLTSYIDSIKEYACFNYKRKKYVIPPEILRETFLNNSNNLFNNVWLEHLQIHDEPILKDTEKEIFFSFRNCLVTLSQEGIKMENWSSKKGVCVWSDQIIQHDFNYVNDCSQSHFYQFLKNVTKNDNERLIGMYTGIGYLLHHHYNETEGQAVVFYDESVTDISTPMGGSGKGLIVNAIKQVRNVSKIDGKNLESNNRFKWSQITTSTQVAWLDDLKPDFDFSILHSNLTDGWTVERKFLSEFLIKPEDSPKAVICSNSIIKGNGTTNKRRQFVIELSDFYSSQIRKGDEKPIEETHGCIFFSDTHWNRIEWDMFFSTMIDCSYQYLKTGLVQHKSINIELNKLRQETEEEFASWAIEHDFEWEKRYDTDVMYKEFIKIYYGDNHQIGRRKFSNYLKAFAEFMKWKYKNISSNGVAYFKFST